MRNQRSAVAGRCQEQASVGLFSSVNPDSRILNPSLLRLPPQQPLLDAGEALHAAALDLLKKSEWSG